MIVIEYFGTALSLMYAVIVDLFDRDVKQPVV